MSIAHKRLRMYGALDAVAWVACSLTPACEHLNDGLSLLKRDLVTQDDQLVAALEMTCHFLRGDLSLLK